MPKMSIASSMVSRWYSDQYILLVAPRAIVEWSPVRAEVKLRSPLICMIFTFDHASASRWRTSGSLIFPLALATWMMASSSFWKRR